MIVLKIGKERVLLNELSVSSDKQVSEILERYPQGAQIDFVKPTLKDLLPININEIINSSKRV